MLTILLWQILLLWYGFHPPDVSEVKYDINIMVKVLSYSLYHDWVIPLWRLHLYPRSLSGIIGPVHSCFHFNLPGSIQSDWSIYSALSAFTDTTVYFLKNLWYEGDETCPRPPLWQTPPGFEPITVWSLIQCHSQLRHTGQNQMNYYKKITVIAL